MAVNAEHRRHSEDPLILAALAVIVAGLVAVLVWLFWHVGHEEGEAAAALQPAAAYASAEHPVVALG